MADPIVIGPTFPYELAAAGLPHPPISWFEDGTITGRENLTPEEAAILDSVLAAHVPRPLTPAEEFAIKADQMDEATLALGFDHENRLLVLEGLPPLTIGDFIAKVKKLPPTKR